MLTTVSITIGKKTVFDLELDDAQVGALIRYLDELEDAPKTSSYASTYKPNLEVQ